MQQNPFFQKTQKHFQNAGLLRRMEVKHVSVLFIAFVTVKNTLCMHETLTECQVVAFLALPG